MPKNITPPFAQKQPDTNSHFIQLQKQSFLSDNETKHFKVLKFRLEYIFPKCSTVKDFDKTWKMSENCNSSFGQKISVRILGVLSEFSVNIAETRNSDWSSKSRLGSS